MLSFKRNNRTDSLTDEHLLARYIRTHDAALLGQLYARYMPMVYGVCLKILRDPAHAEDAVMAIYEEVARKAPAHEITAFRGWLYVLARNYCLMEWRKRQRGPTDLFPPEDMQRFDAVEPVFDIEAAAGTDHAALHHCMDQLPELQLHCVRLFYFDDKSYKEIADLLLEEVGKVRSFIQNGRRNLKNCLEKKFIKPEF